MPLLIKMPTIPPINPATELSALAGTRLADAAGPARVEALVPPTAWVAAKVVGRLVTVGPPPVGAAAVRAKTVGVNRFGPDCGTAAGPVDELRPLLPNAAVTTGAEPPPAAGPPRAGSTLAAPNKLFGVTSAARSGPAEIVAGFAVVDGIGVCSGGRAVLPAARTPTATVAVNTVVLLAIVIAESFPRRAPRADDWLIALPV